MRRILALAALALSLLASAPAQAQSDFDFDEDAEASSGRKAAKSKAKKDVAVREIERGVYLKAAAGGSFILGPRSSVLGAGTALSITVGMDVVDKPKLSVAWELGYYNAIHNSRLQARPEARVSEGGVAGADPSVLLQGDTHIMGALAGVEVSGYPVRRVGIGARLGGGVGFAPLMIPREYYETVVIKSWARELGVAEQSATPSIHEGPFGIVYVGPTLEYYTKLSHFSLGLDVDFTLLLWPFDYGLAASAYLKYTF